MTALATVIIIMRDWQLAQSDTHDDFQMPQFELRDVFELTNFWLPTCERRVRFKTILFQC